MMIQRKDEIQYWLTEHLRLNGVYWGLIALHLLGHPDALPREDTIKFVLSCQNTDGGFGAAPRHDSHMLYTTSAVQILATIGALDSLDSSGGRRKVGSFIAQLQHESGTFAGDRWGEKDTRFLHCAFIALSILDLMDMVDVTKAVDHIQLCSNLDGAFGTSPGAESHSGQVFTCVGALSIARRLDIVDFDRLGAWLSERQLPNGGLNGRPEKLEDVCYSWWVLSSLAIIKRLHWIDGAKLSNFILRCQDSDHGGMSDRPGDMVDVFHTVFGVAGLSLLGYPGLVSVDPV
jgi:geranylgeranyl transferase type-2 subunit beta